MKVSVHYSKVKVEMSILSLGIRYKRGGDSPLDEKWKRDIHFTASASNEEKISCLDGKCEREWKTFFTA